LASLAGISNLNLKEAEDQPMAIYFLYLISLDPMTAKKTKMLILAVHTLMMARWANKGQTKNPSKTRGTEVLV